MSLRDAVFTLLLFLASFAHAADAAKGHLLIIGGGLLPENSAVYERMIGYAGGRQKARFGILPTASVSPAGAQRIAKRLADRGVPAAQIQVINLMEANAALQAANPEIVEQIRGCTAVFFAGGDQRRIARALFKADGSDTPALAAIRGVWERGGLIAGSSAGAAIQSETMISVSGLPDESLDDGMDSLDFGLTRHPARRGVLVTRGLGFFRGGVIDQHFSQYRGRLGRLTRVTVEERIRFGFGIDENTALDVAPDGTFEVVGPGHVTVVDAAAAKCEDGPLGCRMTDVRLSCLAAGDRFDPQSGVATVHPAKKPIPAGKESNNGNYLITDITGPHTVLHALISGLADNTSRKQVGVTLRYNQHYGHGYRFTFWETDLSRGYDGEVDEISSTTVIGVNLNIEPVTLTLEPPQKGLPVDLPEGPSRKSIETSVFRGILLCDDKRCFRPNEPISRAEFASALAHTLRLEPARRDPPRITDVPPTSPWADDIALVVAARLMTSDDRGAFRPSEPVSRQEAAASLVRLSEAYCAEKLSCEPFKLDDLETIFEANRDPVFAAVRAKVLTAKDARFRPADPLTRAEAAAAVYQVIGFGW